MDDPDKTIREDNSDTLVDQSDKLNTCGKGTSVNINNDQSYKIENESKVLTNNVSREDMNTQATKHNWPVEVQDDLTQENGKNAYSEENEEDTSEANENVENDDSNSTPEFNNKRIILQRFTIYNSLTTMYIVGSNAKENLFRILEIGIDPNDKDALMIIEDKNYFYTRKDMIELINGLNESIEGGIHKIAQGYGLLGFIKFTIGYYLCLITKSSQVAILGGHFIYHVDETKLIPLDFNYKRPEKYSDEERLLSIFKYLDLGKTFYFSYAYDITNTLQTNFIRNKRLATEYQYKQENESDTKTFTDNFDTFDHNERFVWNKLLLEPILRNPDFTTYEWFQPIIHGFIDQANISIYGKKIYITIIARRSHHFAGARFLKRGVNDKGNVANEVETEQIVSDMLVSSFHDPKYGFYNNPRFTSFVQHRGSIPLYWTQDLNRLPKPPIEINLSDPFYQSSAIHFNNLFQRYGSPIIILNLIKTKEKQPRESRLNQHFTTCIKYLNQFLPEVHKLQFYSFDMSKHSKKNLDVIQPLQNIASKSIDQIGFFHNGVDLATTKIQKGIIRTNCIDCLDRTNAAQFVICKEALSYQLTSLGLISASTTLDYDSDLINILTEIFHDHGDTIAVQYGGSNLVNTMDSYRRINQWSSHTRDILNSIKRIYSNSFMDSIRQEAINLFLGSYVYDPNKPKLWELQNDFYLHNDILIKDIRVKVSYIHWYNNNYLSNTRFSLKIKDHDNGHDREGCWGSYQRLEPYPDYNDNWFNECYVPRKYQSLNELFQFNMNSNARYFPSTISNDREKKFDYSPFESRKPTLRSNKQGEFDARSSKNGFSNLKYLETCTDNNEKKYNNIDEIEENDEDECLVDTYSDKELSNENKKGKETVSQIDDLSSNHYLNITNPNKIKNFLAGKIEKLGYTAKSINKKDNYSIENKYVKSPNLDNFKSIATPKLAAVNEDQETLIHPKVNGEDTKLYQSQLDLAALLSLNSSPSSSMLLKSVNHLETKCEDDKIYKYYTSKLIISSENNNLADAAHDNTEYSGDFFINELDSLDPQDLRIYSQYLGLDDDKIFNLSATDDYFR